MVTNPTHFHVVWNQVHLPHASVDLDKRLRPQSLSESIDKQLNKQGFHLRCFVHELLHHLNRP